MILPALVRPYRRFLVVGGRACRGLPGLEGTDQEGHGDLMKPDPVGSAL